MSTGQQHYLAYMLRLWQVSSDGEPTWRASVESPHSGERKGFASLDDLFDFLRRQTGPVLDANGDEMEIQHEIGRLARK